MALPASDVGGGCDTNSVAHGVLAFIRVGSMRVTLICAEIAVPDHVLAVVTERVGGLSGHQGGKGADVLDRIAAWVENVGEEARGRSEVVGQGG
jgi:hypothetical protein